MDKIFIENLHISGRHGALDHERSYEQKFLVDISVDFDTQLGAKSDKLVDTLDYARLRDIARDTIESQSSVYLIEKLADTIARKILTKDARIESVTITIRKPSIFPTGVPGVTIARTQKKKEQMKKNV